MDFQGRVTSSYEDLRYTSLTIGEMTATNLGDYTSIINTHNENKFYNGKYRWLSANISGTSEQFPNLIKNGSFKSGTESWTCSGSSSTDGVSNATYLTGLKSYYMSKPSETKYISQNVSLDSENIHGNILIASAWAKASGQIADTSVIDGSDAKFEMRLKVTFTDGATSEYTEKFDSMCDDDWQYIAVPVSLDYEKQKLPKSANVTLDYSNNKGSCYFTNVRLFTVKGTTSTVNYDVKQPDGVSQKIRKTITKKDGRITTIDYEDEKSDIVMTELVDSDNHTFTNLNYYNFNHTLRKTVDYRGVTTEYNYDTFGNVNEKRIYASGNHINNIVERTDYHDNGVFVKKEYDTRSEKIYSQYDYKDDLLASRTEPNKQVYSYTYDANNDDMMSVSATVGSKTPKNEFEYSHGNLTKVMHNGYTYKFDYDGLNRNTSIIAGDTTLVSLAYTLGKTSTVKSTYGNGFTTVVTSDSRDNPINKTVNDTEISAAEYDEVGNPVKLLDKIRNICYTYQYDSDGNVISVTEAPISGSGTKVENTTTYDEVSGRVTRKKYGAVGHEYVPIYETDSEGHIYPDNVEVGVKLVNQYTDVTQRDNYGRTTLRTLTKSGNSKALITEAYQYYVNNVTNASHRETNFVETHQQTIGDDISKFEYTYDDSGNIATVKKDGKDFAKYTYDGLNRLIQEDNFQFMRSYTWTYDDGGNITEKRIYTLTASGAQGSLVNTVPYGYDSKWKDKLISYGDNKDFAYDALGNPTRYRGNALTWTNVRRLERYGSNKFYYGADGIRYKKNNTTYTLDGSRILKETNGTRTLTYFYGTDGVAGFIYNGMKYFYQKNHQGDVIAIYDANGVKQAEYLYDAWGKVEVKNCEGSCCDIGNINPFRYRSYYYDTETGLYYLETRYYDPEVERFINADELDYLGEGDELSNYNLFAYCGNNPVNSYDVNGNWSLPNWAKITIGAIATVAAVAITVATGGAAAPVLLGVAASTLTGGAIGYVTGGTEGMIDGLCDGFMWGGIGALASSSVSAVRAVKTAKQGIAIGENMNRVGKATQVVDGTTYKAMKGYKTIKKIPKIGQQLADKLSIAHNKAFITRMTKLGAAVYDTGPAGANIASRWYAMERQVVEGYFNYVKMF